MNSPSPKFNNNTLVALFNRRARASFQLPVLSRLYQIQTEIKHNVSLAFLASLLKELASKSITRYCPAKSQGGIQCRHIWVISEDPNVDTIYVLLPPAFHGAVVVKTKQAALVQVLPLCANETALAYQRLSEQNNKPAMQGNARGVCS